MSDETTRETEPTDLTETYHPGDTTHQELLALSVVVREQSRVTREASKASRQQAATTRHESDDLAHQVDTLTRALATRTEIATAMGLLMARQNISSEEAFAVLRRASQRTNRKLRDIAVDMLVVHHQRIGQVEQPRHTA